MKKLIIVTTLIVFVLSANAQSWEKMKSGKYIKNDAKNMFVGQWVTDEPGKEIELLITTKKTHIKAGQLNYYTDAIFIKLLYRVFNGEEISKKLKDPIMLTGNSRRYENSLLKDPITGYDIIIKLSYIDKDSLKLNANTMYAPGTSTIFPLGDTILKRKRK